MRHKYLFVLASMCHLRPSDVDELTVRDFWSLVVACERTIAAQSKG